MRQPVFHLLCLGILSTSFMVHAAELPYRDARLPVETRVTDLLSRMTLDEKIGQMLMGGRHCVTSEVAHEQNMGSLLSGGGSVPTPNSVPGWVAMMEDYQDAAHDTRLGIPVLYGVDATHGFTQMPGATVFPQQVGLGAARDPDLMRRIGEITAREMAAVGVYWNFAPMVSVVDDIRWGRTYEALGEDTESVSTLAAAYTRGFQSALTSFGPTAPRPVVTAKHYVGDGGVLFGTASFTLSGGTALIDRGDTRGDSARLMARHLPPYKAQIEAGARSVMASFNRWNGVQMHANSALLNDVLRQQLGFTGLVVSDWEGVQRLAGGFDQQLADAANAGIDVFMEPCRTTEVLTTLRKDVEQQRVSLARIDQAVSNILRVKFEMGLFEHDGPIKAAQALLGSPAHRDVAREAVRKSLVLLKNDGALPLQRGRQILVAGRHADDLGLQSGGWTLDWQGFSNNNARLPGATSILAGMRSVAGGQSRVEFSRSGEFSPRVASAKSPADVALVVIGEGAYAEWLGDRSAEALRISLSDEALIARVRPLARKLVLVLVTGRPLVLGDALQQSDAVVVAWLPGSEGAGVAEVLYGDTPFVGKLPYGWPRSAMGIKPATIDAIERRAGLLFEAGFGL